MTKRERRRLSADGLPVDARDWTDDDWRDLHEAIETVKRKVRERHARDDRRVIVVYAQPGCIDQAHAFANVLFRRGYNAVAKPDLEVR